jgi:hypothetical protein
VTPDPAVGLCSVCRFSRVQETTRGARFWRCLRADDDAHYLRYPPLPIAECPGHERRAACGDGESRPDGG